jgi:hypothetical protein
MPERHLGTDALHRHQDAEPFPFGFRRKSVEADHVFAHNCLDKQDGCLACPRQACRIRDGQCTWYPTPWTSRIT